MQPITYANAVGFPGYRVGTDGSVWTCWQRYYPKGCGKVGVRYRMGSGWNELKPCRMKSGYLTVRLRNSQGRMKHVLIHRLVLEAFVGPCPDGMECRHYPDNTRSNNQLPNLSWGTRQTNQGDRVFHGTHAAGEMHGRSVLTDKQAAEIFKLAKSGKQLLEVSRLFGVHRSTVSKIANGISYKMATKHLRET